MPNRRGNKLEIWEVALVKAMFSQGDSVDQDILAYFTRPTRSINHRLIGQIRKEVVHKTIKAASKAELNKFLTAWPDVDSETGLNIVGDELLIKSREAMISAVQTFNSAGITFRSELFIVITIIAWTYLLHSWYKREGIDYRYKKNGVVCKTKNGEERYWELGQCLKSPKSPISSGVRRNLEFLIEVRHEIEHRSTNRIDDAISAKLQACCINFNDAIKSWFGAQYSLEQRLPIALQFVTFSSDQREVLKQASTLPRHIETMMANFHEKMSDEEISDPAFGYRVAFFQKLSGKPKTADEAIEFVDPSSAEGKQISRVLLRNIEQKKYRPSDVWNQMKKEGFAKFGQTQHTDLWKNGDAKNPKKGFGTLIAKTWYWYESWVSHVRKHCENHSKEYRN